MKVKTLKQILSKAKTWEEYFKLVNEEKQKNIPYYIDILNKKDWSNKSITVMKTVNCGKSV